FFKKYNDHYGHLAGDHCLRQVANALSSGTRQDVDIAARYGGEEFAVIMPNIDADGARRVAERARGAVNALGVPHAQSPMARFTTPNIMAGTRCARPMLPNLRFLKRDLTSSSSRVWISAKGAGSSL